MRNRIVLYYGALFAVAAAAAAYFWPVVHTGIVQNDLQAWVTANADGIEPAHAFPIAAAIDSLWRFTFSERFVKFLQWALLILNACTLGWLVHRLTDSRALSIVAPVLLLCSLEVHLAQDAIIGTSLKYQIVCESALLAFAWIADFRKSGALKPLILSLFSAFIGALTLPVGVLLAAIAPVVLVRKGMRYPWILVTVSFFFAALASVCISGIEHAPIPPVTAPSVKRLVLDLVSPLPTFYRAYGGLTRDRFDTQFNYDDRFLGFPDCPLSGYLIAIVGSSLVWFGINTLRSKEGSAETSDLLLVGLVFFLVPALAGSAEATSPHFARIPGNETYLCSFGFSALISCTICRFVRRKRHYALSDALPVLAGFLCFFILVGNARANSFVFSRSKIAASATALLREAARKGLFDGTPTNATIFVPNLYPFSAMTTTELKRYMKAVTGRSYGIVSLENAHSFKSGERWLLTERYGRKWPSKVALGHIAEFRGTTPLVDSARIYLGRAQYKPRAFRKRGVSVIVDKLVDGGELVKAQRTCSASPLASVLDPERPNVTWGNGFLKPEGFVRLLFVRSYALKAGKNQRWRYAGNSATFNVSWKTPCHPAPLVLTARVFTAVPSKVTLSAPHVRIVSEPTSQTGNYVRIELPAARTGNTAVRLDTRAPMPESDPLGPRYISMQHSDIRMLVMNVSAGFINVTPIGRKKHAQTRRQ